MAGWVVKGNTADATLEKVLFEIDPGTVSEPLLIELPAPEGEDGAESEMARPEFYRLVMVEKRIEPGELTVEANIDVIEEWMMGDPRYQRQLQEFFANLRAKSDIVVLSPRYKALGDAYKAGREAREQRLSEAEERAPAIPLDPDDLPPGMELQPE